MEWASSTASPDQLSRLLIITSRFLTWASKGQMVAQMAKNLPAVQETQVRSPGWEDPLEKGVATHSHILAWRIPWRSGGLYSHGLQEAEITIFPCNCWRCSNGLWNLEKWYRWTYLQGRKSRNRNTNIWIPRREEGWDELGDWNWHLFATMYKMCKIDNQWEPTV